MKNLGTAADFALLCEHVARYGQRQLFARYDTFEAMIEELAASPEERALWKSTLSSGRHVSRARLKWCREARLTLQELAEERNGVRE